MMKTLTLLAVAVLAPMWAADDAPKPKPIEEALWEKTLADNGKEAEKAYAAYQKALDAASAKVIKALEANIKDLNNSKKFGNLGMKERAAAIEALEGRIKDVKEQGAVGEAIAAGNQGDLLGNQVDMLGRWQLVRDKSGYVGVLDIADRKNATFTFGGRVNKGVYSIRNGVVYITWDDAKWEIYTKASPFRTIQVGNPDLDGVFTRDNK